MPADLSCGAQIDYITADAKSTQTTFIVSEPSCLRNTAADTDQKVFIETGLD